MSVIDNPFTEGERANVFGRRSLFAFFYILFSAGFIWKMITNFSDMKNYQAWIYCILFALTILIPFLLFRRKSSLMSEERRLFSFYYGKYARFAQLGYLYFIISLGLLFTAIAIIPSGIFEKDRYLDATFICSSIIFIVLGRSFFIIHIKRVVERLKDSNSN